MTEEARSDRLRREAAERSRQRGQVITAEEVERRACQACGRIPPTAAAGPCPFCSDSPEAA